MHVEATINVKRAQALIDTRASHNVIKVDEAKRLGLKIEKSDGWLKTVNLEAKPLNGVAWDVELQLGPWRRKANFSIVPLDDFTLVLGMEYLRQFNVVPLPKYNSMCILEGAPYLVPTASKATPLDQLSAMKISKGCKRHDDTFPATIHEVSDGKDAMAMELVPEVVGQVLEAYKDVMPPKLPKWLPPRRKVDHKIDLEYKPEKDNLVADALSWKAELAAMIQI